MEEETVSKHESPTRAKHMFIIILVAMDHGSLSCASFDKPMHWYYIRQGDAQMVSSLYYS